MYLFSPPQGCRVEPGALSISGPLPAKRGFSIMTGDYVIMTGEGDLAGRTLSPRIALGARRCAALGWCGFRAALRGVTGAHWGDWSNFLCEKSSSFCFFLTGKTANAGVLWTDARARKNKHGAFMAMGKRVIS